MASENPPRTVRLPSQQQVVDALRAEFANAGYDVEDVVIDAAARPAKVTVVADGDDGLNLDALASLSRLASELMDRLDDAEDDVPYLLEVTSRGVESPLEADRHYRRAQGRMVEITLTDGARITGRLGELSGRTLGLVVADRRKGPTVREISLDDVTNAVVQVEFSSPNPLELELAGMSGKEGEE